MNTGDLTAALSAAGALPESWAAVFAEVDRAGFIPARIWFDDEQGRTQPLDRDDEPYRWRSAVCSDEPIVTQLDDGATVWPATSNAATSSASQPSMVLSMSDALDVQHGQKVLEIGTGTGYNAALLAHRLVVGAESPSGVDVTAGQVCRGAGIGTGRRQQSRVISGQADQGVTPWVTMARRHQCTAGEVTVGEVGGRTVALYGGATEGNVSPQVAFWGTSADGSSPSSVGQEGLRRRRSARAAAAARPATPRGARPCRSPEGQRASGTPCSPSRVRREACGEVGSPRALGLVRRELDVTDLSAQADVGGVEFTTRTIAAQVVPGGSGGSGVASTPDGLPEAIA